MRVSPPAGAWMLPPIMASTTFTAGDAMVGAEAGPPRGFAEEEGKGPEAEVP